MTTQQIVLLVSLVLSVFGTVYFIGDCARYIGQCVLVASQHAARTSAEKISMFWPYVLTVTAPIAILLILKGV